MWVFSINKLAPKPKKILQLFRLRQLHNGVFVKLNRATWNMIKMVEPFITYGYPTRQSISKLIYKRGFGKVDRSRIPLTDNSIVDGQLGKHGIACVEDLITRSPPADQSSRRPTTSCGHSSFPPHLVVLRSRDTPLLKALELSATERNSSTPSLRRWCEYARKSVLADAHKLSRSFGIFANYKRRTDVLK